jgi:hypothetical protein
MKNNTNLYASDGTKPLAPSISVPIATDDLEDTQNPGEPDLEGWDADLEKLDMEDLEKVLQKLKRQKAECEGKFQSFKGHLRELQVEYNYCWSRLVQPLHEQDAHHVPLRVRLETAGELLTKRMGKKLKEMKVEAVEPEEVWEIKDCEPQQGRLVKSLSTSNLNMPC